MIRKTVFLDKDGTLVVDKPYNVHPNLVVLEDGVIEGLLLLQQRGYQFVIISNQPGIALGLFDHDALNSLISYLQKLFNSHGIAIDHFYFCPHLPENARTGFECDCRKPQPGLILNAANDLNIDLNASWMIGDILNDVEAGNLAGCNTILIDNGNETEWLTTETRTPTFTADNFLSAALYISNLN